MADAAAGGECLHRGRLGDGAESCSLAGGMVPQHPTLGAAQRGVQWSRVVLGSLSFRRSGLCSERWAA